MDREIMERCRAKLIEIARSRGTITYGDLAHFLRVANQSVGVYLDPIYEEEIAKGRPDLTVVVVYLTTGMGRYNSRGRHVRSVKVDPANDDDVRAYRDELTRVYEYWSRSRFHHQPPSVPTIGSHGTFGKGGSQHVGGVQRVSETTSDLTWENFELGFWHPFGSHGRESPDDIVNRKRSETERNGWTLWSFQYRRPESLNEWHRELSFAKPGGPVVVFCSRGDSTVDPDRPGSLTRTADCREYRFIGHDDAHWRPVPPLIRVPHPFGPKKTVASAFVVRRVHYPIEPFQAPFVEWLSQGKWHQTEIPTRPEYLIRRGGNIAMRNVRAVLELQPPYLAIVKL